MGSRLAGWRGTVTAAVAAGAVLVSGCDSSAQPASFEPMPDPDPVVGCPAPGPGIAQDGRNSGQADFKRTPVRRLVLMGGSAEVDAASRSFVTAASGGDILILRATGSLTSYPDYFTTGLSADPGPGTVVTVRTDSPAASADAAVFCRVKRAEAIWLAGGNQWHYLGGWPAAVHDSLRVATEKGIAFGGTSAGAMVLGEWAFDARNGTVSSETALGDPTNAAVSVSRSPFPQPELAGALVDTHFSERNREGRLVTFLAQVATTGEYPIGIGIDERTALIVEDGGYRVLSSGGSVWLYQIHGDVVVEAGRPLTLLEYVVRARLDNTDQGVWPPPFVDSVDTLFVKQGVLHSQ